MADTQGRAWKRVGNYATNRENTEALFSPIRCITTDPPHWPAFLTTEPRRARRKKVIEYEGHEGHKGISGVRVASGVFRSSAQK